MKRLCYYEMCAKEFILSNPNQKFCTRQCWKNHWYTKTRDHRRKLAKIGMRKYRQNRTPEQLARDKSYAVSYREKNRELLRQNTRDHYWLKKVGADKVPEQKQKAGRKVTYA